MTLNINYDKRHDVLYARMPSSEECYGDENDNGIVTFLGIDTDEIKGVAIYDFARRLRLNTLSAKDLPIPFDFYNPELQRLLSSAPEIYKCVLQQ